MKKPEYNPHKGIACYRVGGLSPVKQTHENRPAKRGIWAFVYPYFDWWFLSGRFSLDKFPKKEVAKHLAPKPRKFWAKGEIYTRLSVPGAELTSTGWYKTTCRELYAYLSKQFAKDLGYCRRIFGGGKKSGEIKHPYKGLGCISVDAYEVFIPNRTQIR
jgi:hypothetical protein